MSDDLTPEATDVSPSVTESEAGGVFEDAAPAPATRSMGQRLVKGVIVLALLAVVVFVLFTWVFPWMHAAGFDPTMGGDEG